MSSLLHVLVMYVEKNLNKYYAIFENSTNIKLLYLWNTQDIRKELKSSVNFLLDTQLWKIGTDGTTLQNRRCPGRSEWKLITDNSGSKLRKIARVSSIFALGIQISCPSYGPNIFMRRYFSITGELTNINYHTLLFYQIES